MLLFFIVSKGFATCLLLRQLSLKKIVSKGLPNQKSIKHTMKSAESVLQRSPAFFCVVGTPPQDGGPRESPPKTNLYYITMQVFLESLL